MARLRCTQFISGVVLLFVACALDAAPRAESEPQRWIAQHAQRVKSEELPAARLQVVGDIDGDARDDMAVLYTLKARVKPHAERRYLAVFVSGAGAAGKPGALRYQAHVVVGGPGLREVNRVTVLKRVVVLEVLNHAPGDAACCPSRPGVRRYRLAEGKLALVHTERRK